MIEASRKEIDISSLTDQDLRKLKTDVTFLYYYIPSIRDTNPTCVMTATTAMPTRR